jgi:hypothetical protein
MDIKKQFSLTPQEFIEEGKPFTVVVNWEKGNEEVSVTSRIVKEGDDYKLIIKGDYLRASSAEIMISHPTIALSLNDKLAVAFNCMSEYVPFMVTDDYPVSLKKVAADNKAREYGWSLLKPGYEDYDLKVWEGFEDTKYYNDPYWVHDNGEIWRHTSMGYGPPIFNQSKPEVNQSKPEDTDEEYDYPVVCVDCGEEKVCNSLQDAYDQGWFATDDGEHCPEHADAAIEEENKAPANKAPANNCLTYN